MIFLSNNLGKNPTISHRGGIKNFTIIVDTREQSPYSFQGVSPIPDTIVRGLSTGDYSLDGYEDRVTVERKSLSDLYGSVGTGRDRFEREMGRMAQLEFSAVVVEAEWSTIILSPPSRSRLKPVSVLATIIAWMQRYDVHWLTCPNRVFAEKLTHRILDRWYRDEQTGLHIKDAGQSRSDKG